MLMAQLRDRLFAEATPDANKNERGNQVYRISMGGDRYCVDFADDFFADGWQQFDTSQDASYFGVWVNPWRRLVLCYAEGDLTLTDCPDKDHYLAEIRSMIDFYEEGFIAYTFSADGGGRTYYRQNREEMFLTV